MMVENIGALLVIVGAAFYAKDNRVHLLMISKYVSISIIGVAFGDITQPPFFESYYLLNATVITICACICITMIMTKAAYYYSLLLTVQAIVSAIVILDTDFTYDLFSFVNGDENDFSGIILPLEIGLAWYAACRSRMG